MSVLITMGVLALVGLWLVGRYNRLIGLRNQVTNGWTQIDVQLKRRHDLVPNLVNTVKGAMEFERDTLEAVVAARNRAVAATGPADAGRREGELTAALGRFFALAEQYPQLTANQNVRMLQEELAATENKVGFARQFYNDIATKYNTATQVIPTNFIAGVAGFKSAELFEIANEAERAVPTVDLSTRRG
ncbi:MAG: LemA family protein [Acidobacteria bacterium]|nr:LemA family protein [Acidobacteriota bacterium]